MMEGGLQNSKIAKSLDGVVVATKSTLCCLLRIILEWFGFHFFKKNQNK